MQIFGNVLFTGSNRREVFWSSDLRQPNGQKDFFNSSKMATGVRVNTGGFDFTISARKGVIVSAEL